MAYVLRRRSQHSTGLMVTECGRILVLNLCFFQREIVHNVTRKNDYTESLFFQREIVPKILLLTTIPLNLCFFTKGK